MARLTARLVAINAARDALSDLGFDPSRVYPGVGHLSGSGPSIVVTLDGGSGVSTGSGPWETARMFRLDIHAPTAMTAEQIDARCRHLLRNTGRLAAAGTPTELSANRGATRILRTYELTSGN